MSVSIAETMSATVLTGHGSIDKLVHRRDVPVPQPNAGDVLVRVGACGVNNTDINTRTAWYDTNKVESAVSEELGINGGGDDAASSWSGSTVEFPRIQGAAVVGRIAAVGADVDESRIGQRVLVDPSVRDASRPYRAQLVQYLGSERDGGFAEYVVVPDGNAHNIDSTLTDAELSTFPCSYDTAEEMLARTRLADGETLLVTGAAGGVGSALVQLALLRGARVIAIAGAEKEQRVKELGAHEFIARDRADLSEAVARLVGDGGVDVAADVVGGDMFDFLLKALKRGGRYATAGAIGGPVARIDLRDLIYKDLEMYGITNPTVETFVRVVELIETGKLRPLLDGIFPLSELQAAQRQLLARRHFGKLAIVPGLASDTNA